MTVEILLNCDVNMLLGAVLLLISLRQKTEFEADAQYNIPIGYEFFTYD